MFIDLSKGFHVWGHNVIDCIKPRQILKKRVFGYLLTPLNVVCNILGMYICTHTSHILEFLVRYFFKFLNVSMKHRIEKEKLMLINHVKQLDNKTLAKQMYNQQVENKWPGLAEETKKICRRLKISDINTTHFDKHELKDWIKKATKREDEIMMREDMEGKTKTKT